MSRTFRRLANFVALAVLTTAAVFAIRLGIADHAFRQQTPESVTRALSLSPHNTAYLSQRALQLDYDNQDSTPLLRQAAELNPLASAPRIRLGLAAEAQGDIAMAEKWLLDAAMVDHQYEPRWTLANFYFRQRRQDDFWKWMRMALEVSYGDRRLAFDLCWLVSSRAEEILARAIPPAHEVMSAYLTYILTRHREATESTALELAAMQKPEDVPLLEAACDLLIDMGQTTKAVELWRKLGHPPAMLTNGDFSQSPRGHGFDWRLLPQAGVNHTNLAAPPRHRISLSGAQAEACELLRQYVMLEPGRRYRLRWDARTLNLASPTGLEWIIGDKNAPLENAADWRAGNMTFTAPTGLMPVRLAYRRPLGQTRAEGYVEIGNVVLTADGP